MSIRSKAARLFAVTLTDTGAKRSRPEMRSATSAVDHHVTNGVGDLLDPRQPLGFLGRRVGRRSRRRGPPLDWGIQVPYPRITHSGRNFGTEATGDDRLVRNDEPIGLAHRGKDGSLVERLNGAQVDDFDINP